VIFIPEAEYARIQAVLPILCVDCLIVHEKKCLLLRRVKEPAKGQYWFPGGRILKGETIKDASLRKARDEVTLDCQFERVISIEETIFEQQGDMLSGIHTVNICCQLSAHNFDNLTLDESHDGYIWVDLEHAKRLNLHTAVLTPLRKCLERIT
jgi:colanic acid biosynthesis protein WcaH